jgi:hypothetical protein
MAKALIDCPIEMTKYFHHAISSIQDVVLSYKATPAKGHLFFRPDFKYTKMVKYYSVSFSQKSPPLF